MSRSPSWLSNTDVAILQQIGSAVSSEWFASTCSRRHRIAANCARSQLLAGHGEEFQIRGIPFAHRRGWEHHEDKSDPSFWNDREVFLSLDMIFWIIDNNGVRMA